jgi:uncharacterized protein (DUF427 family)
VSLTTGRGPLGRNPAGRFSAPLPAGVVYVEPFPRRVRGVLGGWTVVASDRVALVHRTGHPPSYAFPAGDVDVDRVAATPDADAPGHLAVAWDAVDAWYEEEEQVFGHPRNPYHRVDCVRTSRRLRVDVGDVTLVDTTDTLGVYETALAPRLYVHPDAVRAGALVPSATTSYCPYKGTASWWSAAVAGVTVADVAWSYEDPLPESLPIRGLLSFDDAVVTLVAEVPG